MRRGAGLLAAIAVIIGLIFLVKNLLKGTSGPARQMAKITIVPDTPPPPPPPPKEERKPEPPKETPKEVKIEQPEQEQPKEPPQAEQLKMEGEGSDTGVPGIAAGNVKQDYIGQPTGTGGSGGYAWYGGLLQQHVQQSLSRVQGLRSAEYRVVVRVWLGTDGRIDRADLSGTSGSAEIDERIKLALAELPPLRERPPEGMPQPVKLRVTSRI